MEEAAFSLESYRFTRASFNFDIPAKAQPNGGERLYMKAILRDM